MTKIDINYLLGHLRTSAFHYEHRNMQVFDPRYGHHFPWFNFIIIQHMLLDPRIKYGLNLIKGPIATYTRFFTEEEADSPAIHQAIVELNYHFPYAVVCEDKKQEEFIIRQLNRFWEVALFKALKAIEWGFSGSQVLYRQTRTHAIEFDNLHPYRSETIQAVTKNNGLIGFVRNQDKSSYIPIGKGFWHIHEREENMFYGVSRLKGAHIPWHETWMMGGARDIRRTWFFRNSYDGGEIYYPEGFFQDDNNQKTSNEVLAVRMAEMKRTGSTAVFPSTKGLDGKRSWEYVAPQANATPQGMIEYIQMLRDEELEGLGIPPEVVQSSAGNGLGSATGRMVPLMAFIASLSPIGASLITDFQTQILDRVLLPFNGYDKDYEIRRVVPKSYEGQQVGENQITQTEENTGLGN